MRQKININLTSQEYEEIKLNLLAENISFTKALMQVNIRLLSILSNQNEESLFKEFNDLQLKHFYNILAEIVNESDSH